MQNSQKKEQNSPPLRRELSGGIRRRLARKYIPIGIKNQVFKKAEYQCQYISPLNHARCASKSFLDIDHLIPVAVGGSDEVQNLRVMCRSHYHLLAKQMHLNKEL